MGRILLGSQESQAEWEEVGSGLGCRENQGTEPQRVERVTAFPNLVVSLFFSPRKCLVAKTDPQLTDKKTRSSVPQSQGTDSW